MTPDELDFVLDSVRAHCGLVLKGDPRYALETRLGPLARRLGEPSVSALAVRLRASDDPALLQSVAEALASSEGTFYRDRLVFDDLRDRVLPEIAARRLGGVVRVWSAGCGFGQEIYSLAMTAAEPSPSMQGVNLELFASDFSERALQKARTGLYSHFEVQRGLPIRMLLQHFEAADDLWRVSARLRQQVRWAQINLLHDFAAIGPFDVILCRNVLGGFDPATAARVADSLDQVLAPDGCLVLGVGEEPVLPAAYNGAGPIRSRNAAFTREAA